MDTVGVIGLGLMGGALAGRFLGGGRRVVGFDLRDECRQRRAAGGGTVAASSQAVFEVARTVVLSLPNSEIVAAVLANAGATLSRGTS